MFSFLGIIFTGIYKRLETFVAFSSNLKKKSKKLMDFEERENYEPSNILVVWFFPVRVPRVPRFRHLKKGRSKSGDEKNDDDAVRTVSEKFIFAQRESRGTRSRNVNEKERERGTSRAESRHVWHVRIGSAGSARARDGTDGGNDVTGVVIHMASGVDRRSCCARDRELLSIVSGRRHLGQ